LHFCAAKKQIKKVRRAVQRRGAAVYNKTMKLTNSAGQPITPAQAAFAFTVRVVVGIATLVCMYWATVFAFCM
jgi:hypothetical protein